MNSGIYRIINIKNNKLYIGSTVNFTRRKYAHFRKLFNNDHHSIYLQRAFNKYGKDNFIFEILEFVDLENLIIKEQEFLDLYRPEYNMTLTAGKGINLGLTFSEEHKSKLSYSHKGKKMSRTSRDLMSKSKMKVVLQYTIDNIFIKEWSSIKDAMSVYKYAAISACCNNKRKTAHGFMWKFREEDK